MPCRDRALAEGSNRCKANSRGAAGLSANAEANVADGLAAEALLQFSQDVDLRNLFELVLLIVLVLDPFNQILRLPDE